MGVVVRVRITFVGVDNSEPKVWDIFFHRGNNIITQEFCNYPIWLIIVETYPYAEPNASLFRHPMLARRIEEVERVGLRTFLYQIRASFPSPIHFSSSPSY